MPVKSTVRPVNLMSLMSRFDTDSACRDRLEHLRWPDGVRRPRCDSDKISRIREGKQFDCDNYRYHFSVTAGNILHDSHLSLTKWFVAI